MTDQENLARFIMMRSQGWSFNRITVGFDAARTIGPSELWAASPKNTRNGKIRSKSVKTGKPPLRHVSPECPPPIGYRLLLLLVGYALQRPARAENTVQNRAKSCKKVQNRAIRSRQRLAEPMILSPHHSVCGRETAPQPSTLGTPPFPPFAPVQEPLFSRRAPPNPVQNGAK
jgi:hypothetical protein